MPLAGAAFLAGGLSLVGVPPLPGFWAQRLLVQGLLADQRRGLVVLLLLADLALLAFVLGGFRRAFLRGQPPAVSPARRWEQTQLVLATASVIALGAMAGLLNEWSGAVVGNVLTLSP
jgi:formate hydrogenlyase subunit 3/multisubunit Na+/H+ antiporter MnhD subunit